MPRVTRSLNTWQHFAATWALPDDFGGMTSAIFRRSTGFAAAGAPVTVLTFDDRLDTEYAVARLRDRGVLHPGVGVLHLWDWLAEHPVRAGGRIDLPFSPLDPAAPAPAGGRIDEVEFAGVIRRRSLSDAAGVVLQVDRYRPDGSLLASDLRDSDGVRLSVTVCDPEGSAVRGWTTIWGLYRHWLDLLTDKRRSMLIVDSKTAARFVRGYRRKHVATVHVVHGAHRGGSGEPGEGLKASRRGVLENAADFDAVVVLTERQRADLVADLGPGVRVAVVPNAGRVEGVTDAPVKRDANRGVILASLTARKRVDHAVLAAAEAGAQLDIYGEGPERAPLRQHIDALGASARVRLLGHRPDAALAFRDASFSLLTSTSEGAPLVLVESMAAGCLPIAYDIRYGPGDIIRDGVDGFIVPPGDTEAMAARIREFVAMSERGRRRMRRAAVRSAARYSERRVTAQWAALFEQIAAQRWPAPARRSPAVRVAGRLRRRFASGVREG